MLSEMKKKEVAVIPTLKLWRYETRSDWASRQTRLVGSAVTQLKAWLGVGGEVLFGTDVGYMDDYDTSDEFTLMAEAGMDHRQILASLTTAPARRFGKAERLGKLEAGYLADIVVLQGDPAQSIDAFSSVRYSIRDGSIIFSSDGRR